LSNLIAPSRAVCELEERMSIKLRQCALLPYLAFALVAMPCGAFAQTVDLVCDNTHHVQVNMGTNTVVDGDKSYSAEITDTQVKWDYVADVTGGVPIQGPHWFEVLDRDSGILSSHAGPGQ
jgi:hypothetical protein